MTSQKNGMLQAGFYAGTLTAVIGLLLCVLCRTLLIALSWPNVRSFFPAPYGLSVFSWRKNTTYHITINFVLI